MGNLTYIEELGIGVSQEGSITETNSNNTEEPQEGLSLGSEEKTSDNKVADTESNDNIKSLVESLKSQINGMEKRIADKDAYINELREASKQKEVNQGQEDDTNSNDYDFWSNPEKTISNLKKELEEQKRVTRIQQLQTMEIHYANTVKDYWATVNQDSLKEAVLSDENFAKEFNNSKEPYKVAYEYLKNKAENKTKESNSLREQIRKEILAELNIKDNKVDIPPNINNGGKSSSSVKTAPQDGFVAVFGSNY